MRRPAAAALAALAGLALPAGCGGAPEVYEGPVYDDRFAAAGQWPQQSAGGGTIAVEDGALLLRGTRPRGLVYGAQLAQEQVSRDTRVEARLAITDGRVAGAGVTCRAGSSRGGPEFYAFIVTADGVAQILRVDAGGLRILDSAEVDAARGNRRLRIAASCDGPRLRFEVGGRRVLEAQDRALPKGRGGVVLLVGDDAPAEARFERLVVRTGT